jgi:hypothetical protein
LTLKKSTLKYETALVYTHLPAKGEYRLTGEEMVTADISKLMVE